MTVKYPQDEMKSVLKRVEGISISDMKVVGKGPDGEDFAQPLSYFDPNHTGKIDDMIENLFETCYLNPPQEMWLLTPKSNIEIY